MSDTYIAKLIKSGDDQMVLLPANCQFNSNEVYITRDEMTGNVLLSSCPGAGVWRDFLDLVHSIPGHNDFMADRPMNVSPSEARDTM